MYHLLVLFSIILSTGFVKSEKQYVHLVPDKMSKVLQASTKCVDEIGINLDQALNTFRSRSKQISTDESFQKFIYCLSKKLDVIDNGRLKVDNALEYYPEDVNKAAIRQTMEECNKENGKDDKEIAFKMFKCFHEKTPVHIVF